MLRGFQFLHPDFDAERGPPGLRIAASGGIGMVEDAAAVRQAILVLLTTAPGERVMRPDYGCDLQRLLFSPNDATTHGLAMHYVAQALQRWEPRVDVLRLDASCNERDPGRMDIVLEYRVRRAVGHEALLLSIHLDGESP